MNDQALWEQAVEAAAAYYAALPQQTVNQLNTLIDDAMRVKQSLVDLATTAGSSEVCRSCQGECCKFGKYHVSVLDLLAYLKCGTEPVRPDFGSHPHCPYSTTSGCTMPATFRPMTCVVFNCSTVHDLLLPEALTAFQAQEQELRTTIEMAEKLTGQRLGRPLLLSCG